MSQEQRSLFLDTFSRHRVLLEVNGAGDDPMERVRRFVGLSDDDLDLMITMQIVVARSMSDGMNLGEMLPPRDDTGDNYPFYPFYPVYPVYQFYPFYPFFLVVCF